MSSPARWPAGDQGEEEEEISTVRAQMRLKLFHGETREKIDFKKRRNLDICSIICQAAVLLKSERVVFHPDRLCQSVPAQQTTRNDHETLGFIRISTTGCVGDGELLKADW